MKSNIYVLAEADFASSHMSDCHIMEAVRRAKTNLYQQTGNLRHLGLDSSIVDNNIDQEMAYRFKQKKLYTMILYSHAAPNILVL
jgi:hypothetical protein